MQRLDEIKVEIIPPISPKTTKRLSLFFSGTDMTWEDTVISLQLGAKARHNLRETSAQHFYYVFDGPAAAVSNEHLATEHLKFDANKPDFMTSKPRAMQNTVGYRTRWARGYGTKHIGEAAYQLILHSIINTGQPIQEIDLIGFSRGGSIALNVGALLKNINTDLAGILSKTEIDAIKFNIYAMDPVAGKSRNKQAHEHGKISSAVKKCIVGLAVNESVPGFHPRDILSDTARYNVQFEEGVKYIFLPFPEDHMMCPQWMRDLIQHAFPKNSELLNPCDEINLMKRRLGLDETLKWEDRIDETRAYRMAHFIKHKEKYSHSLLQDNKHGIEEYFKQLDTQHSIINVGHNSLQNDADTEEKNRNFTIDGKVHEIGGLHAKTKSTQIKFAKRNHKKSYSLVGFEDRTCKKKLTQYTNSLFVNLHHEALFAKEYPNLHLFLCSLDIEFSKQAMEEYAAIVADQNPATKDKMMHALSTSMRLDAVSQFKSTNMTSLHEIYELVGGGKEKSAMELQEIKEQNVTKLDFDFELIQKNIIEKTPKENNAPTKSTGLRTYSLFTFNNPFNLSAKNSDSSKQNCIIS